VATSPCGRDRGVAHGVPVADAGAADRTSAGNRRTGNGIAAVLSPLLACTVKRRRGDRYRLTTCKLDYGLCAKFELGTFACGNLFCT
jgi:hypothetical protein